MSLTYKIQRWPHQQEAEERAKDRDGFALFMDMGVGKTATAINILRQKFFAAKKIKSTMVVTVPITVPNWRREFGMHSQISPEKIITLTGPGKTRLVQLEKALEKSSDIIVITNYEALLMKDLFKALLRWKPSCLVVDESQRVKDFRAKRTKAVLQISDTADLCRLLLSGTPILNSPMDIFPQFLVLDRGASFGRSFVAFRNNYFYDKNQSMAGLPKYFPDWRPRPSTLSEFNKIILANAICVKKSECLTLPPLVRKQISVELSPTQKRLYKELKTDLITFLNDKACTAPIALTKALRLQQIVSGYIALEGSENVAIKDNPRAEALAELLSTIAPHHKVLVWCVFAENYATVRAVCTKLDLAYTEITGQISAAQKQKNVATFEADESCRVLIGHPGAGGVGVNLTAASYSIYYSRGFSLEYDLQSEARNFRGGSERHTSITRIDLVAEGTIDALTLKALAGKQEMGDKLLRQLQHEL